MAASSNFYSILILLLICQASAVPLSTPTKADPICSSAQLIGSSQGSLVYKYKTEVKLAVGNGQFDIKNEITSDVHIKSLSDCNYALQLHNVQISETKDEDKTSVTSTASAQKALEKIIVRFRWVDGFLVIVEADESADVDHVNFIKGILSVLQVYSPVPNDGENVVREEDVLGVCTTRYKYSQIGATTQINKNKDLSTCSRDKLHLSSSPVLTSLLGPLIEEVFSAKTRYVCQTDIREKKIQSVKCKTVEISSDEAKKPAKHTHDKIHKDDSSSEEDDVNSNEKDDVEISSKHISIKQELKLQANAVVNVDGSPIKTPVRQTLQFIPTPSFDKSNAIVSDLVSQLEGLLKSQKWDQFASAQFVGIANELRRLDKANIDKFKTYTQLKHVLPALLSTIYSHDPSSSLLNLDSATLKFANPLAVYYLDKPSTELVDQIVQGSYRLTAAQVPEFVGLAATILKTYKARQDNNKDADMKIKDFKKSISKFLNNPSKAESNVTTATLAAYAQLGLYDDQVRRLAANDDSPLEVQYHALNTIRHICDDYINDNDQPQIRADLQKLLLQKVQNKANKNAVRVWAFEALFTSFIYNPEAVDSTLGDNLEKALTNILDEPLNQVNGFIWSALKYSALDRLCPLRGLAARLRAHHDDKKQFLEQATLSSRQIHLDLPLRKNYRAVLKACLVFENDRVVPSFIGFQLAFDGIRRETLRLPWVDAAIINENLDWNFADYILRMDPLHTDVTDDYKEKAKSALQPGVKKLQDAHDAKEEDPDPSVHLYLKLFGADIRSSDVTNKVQDILRSNLRTFVRNQVLNRLKDLTGKNPIFRLPLEIGAASAAANGLTLHKSAQVGLLVDLSNDLKDTRDSAGFGTFSLTSRSALSFSLTIHREVSSPLASLGETMSLGILSNVPFEYTAEADNEGRTRELNFLNEKSTLLATDFQYSLRTSKGIEPMKAHKSASIEPSCTPSLVYRGLGLRACLELNPFRSIQLGSRPSYPITITLAKDPSIKKWRIGWRFNSKDAPQYEVAVEKVGTTGTYPGLGFSSTKTGNNFDIKVLTGMKSFLVKGTLTGTKFDGKVYSSDNKEVLKTSGTLVITSDRFKLDSKLVDSTSNKEVATLATEIVPNRGQGLTADVSLTAPDKAKSFKLHFKGNLYKPDEKLFHINGEFNLGDTAYNGKLHLERNDTLTRIELHRSTKLGKSPAAKSGYDLAYERKTNKGNVKNNHQIAAHLSLQTPMGAMKVLDFKTDFIRTNDLANATLQSALNFTIITRSPPVQERIELDYIRRSVKSASQTRRLVSPEANLKIQVKTLSNVFNFLLDHKHRRSSEPSKKGPETLSPTLDIENKIHIAADSDKLLPDIPRPFAFDILSDLDFELLNKLNYKVKYDLPRRQRSASLTYASQVDKVTDGHLYSGKSTSEVHWDNKQNTATAKGNFVVCTKSRSLKTHWLIDTSLISDKNDMELDLAVRFDRQPKKNAPKSIIVAYNITLKAPKHEKFQLIDLDGNLTRHTESFETYNSIAYRANKTLKEFNLNVLVDRNQTGDGSLHTHAALSLPFKYLPYITHDLVLERHSLKGRLSRIGSQLVAEPVFAHHITVDIDRSTVNAHPRVHVDNEFEYLRANGDNLHVLSKVDVCRWSTLHSFGLFKRNNDVLHKHSIGYIFSNKTRKVALSLESPQLSGNPLSFIGELTIDRENRIGKMKWPQEFGVHLEFGTPLINLTALHVFYNLPMFHDDDDQTLDACLGFKLASPKISPVSFYFNAEGSLSTSLHVSNSLHIGDDIALGTLLTAQYDPQLISQISVTTNSKYYGQEFQNSLFALFKQHQVTVRGILNTSGTEDYKYDMDIGFDEDLLSGHTERTDGQLTTVSDIEAKKCAATGKYYRCYTGDITIQAGNSAPGRKGTFDVKWGRGTAKLDISVPNQIDLKFDHTHSGRLRDEDFSSKTVIDGKSLRADDKGSFKYSGSVAKDDGKWNQVHVHASLSDKKTGLKLLGADIDLNQKVANKLQGQLERTINAKLERNGQPVISWSSESLSCNKNAANVIYGICQATTFHINASNAIAARIRQRLELPVDPKLANPAGQVTYDGKLNVDLKADTKTAPHTVKLDLNRLKEDAVDLDLSLKPRVDDAPMSLDLKATLPKQTPLYVKYDETRKSATQFNGVLKYSFNANDPAAQKTYNCDVDRKDASDVSIDCKGERTTLKIDIDRKAGKSTAYVDLNKFAGERVGYEAVRNPQTQALDATLYTFVTSWHLQRNPGKSTTLIVTQNKKEVLRAEGTKVNDNQIQVKFSPSGVNLRLDWDNTTVITLKQTAPIQQNLATIRIDRATIRHYLPSLRNQNRPQYDIDEALSKSKNPLVEISFDTHNFLSLSQALDKLGSHNGLYGLDTIKKAFKLQIGDAALTVYNTQHWKTHRENSQLPESYSVRVDNNVNGNFIQLSTNKWDEHRLISKVSHSFDGGKTVSTDLKIERNHAHPVGSIFFFHSLGYRNIQGVKQLRNYTRHFLRDHLTKDLNQTNLAELLQDLRKRVRSIADVDYKAIKEIITSWNAEPANSFLRRWSTRLGFVEFFEKYPTYTAASNRISGILLARAHERDEFWRGRFESILSENRLKDLAERVQARRSELIKRLSDRADKLLDRLLPKIDQATIDKRIDAYVTKLVAGFEQAAKRNTEQMKAIFKSIDDASSGEDTKWFRLLVADIDSQAFATAADAETTKMIKKLSDSSRLLTTNIQYLSKRITKRREAIRDRVKNAIQHIPKAYINDTNFELLFPLGREPGSYVGTSELMLALGSLLRNRDQAFDTIRSILQNRMQSRTETMKNYFKALRSLAKRLFKRNPSLVPEFTAIIGYSGDAINVHGDYIQLNPACNHLLTHDFAELQFSLRFINGFVYSLIPNDGQIKEYECSPTTGRVRACCEKHYCVINIPMHLGGRVDGALGDVRDRSGKADKNLNRWILRDCPAATAPKKDGASVLECSNDDDDKQAFCENFVNHGLKNGQNRQELVDEAKQALKALA